MTIATSKNLTVLGILTILGALVAAAVAVFDGDPATSVNFETLLGAIVLGVTQIMAKGAKSTGGAVPETPEAAARLAGGQG